MPPIIKAIPTQYNGIAYRSRTEARWAVFFDMLSIPFTYEAEGYQLPSGWYLPDFLLTLAKGEQVWFEVKGVAPNEFEQILAIELARHTGLRTFIGVSKPEQPDHGWEDVVEYGGILGSVDHGYAFIRCNQCAGVNIVWAEKADRINCTCVKPQVTTTNALLLIGTLTGRLRVSDNIGDPVIRAAIRAASNYSFWNPK